MTRPSKTTGAPDRIARSGSRRPIRLAAGAAFLVALSMVGCTVLGGTRGEGRVDVVVLTTDSTTTDELLKRMERVESVPISPIQGSAAFRGRLTRIADQSVYTIAVVSTQSPDGSTLETLTREAVEAWRPRYVLAIGTTAAVAKAGPIGAVGIVPLICDFDLERFQRLGDTGVCYRADGGLLVAAYSAKHQWRAYAEELPTREGCGPTRVVKMGTLSGGPEPQPDLVEAATRISEEIHRGVAMEGEGAPIARAIFEARQTTRIPIGFLMIRGISEIYGAGGDSDGNSPSGHPERRLRKEACAAHDVADFSVQLIRRRWPVSPRTSY